MNTWRVWPVRRPENGSLARASDRLEAAVMALLLAAGFLVIGLGLYWGAASADAMRNAHPRVGEYALTASAEADAVSLPQSLRSGLVMWPVQLTWRHHDESHTGTVILGRPVAAGQPVDVVVDPAGRPHSAEVTGNPAASGVIVAVMTMLIGWTLLLLVWQGVAELFARYHAARWAGEWGQVEPLWSGRARRD